MGSTVVLLLMLAVVHRCQSADILFIAPTPSVSHALPINAVIRGLLGRGHHVTHITPDPMQDIKKFLDEAKHGVIYFNLGSNVNSSSLSEHKRNAFIDAFREIPQRVVWKWEDKTIPDIPDNVLVRKWLPQQEILAHPNVKLFIMQGGLQSLNEAAYRAIPLIVIPFFSDQTHNCAKINSAGIGIRIYLKDVTKETVLDAIHKIMENSSYKENMKEYSKVFREHRATSLEKTLWWLEYVIRHRGASHLRSAALDLHWWQLLLLDVVGFILAILTAVVTITYCIAKWVVAMVKGKKEKIKRQ